MDYYIAILVCVMSVCVAIDLEHNCSFGDHSELRYPKPGSIPMLNRKIVRGTRVSISEHPYAVSIRRRTGHYLTGTIIGRTVVLSVAHPLLMVPIYELGVVVGENYSDRGTTIDSVILTIIHKDFNRFTLTGDMAILKLYDKLNYKISVKPVKLPFKDYDLEGGYLNAFVSGWGRCDLSSNELCLPRSSIYYPNEIMDPMLRTVSFPINLNSLFCQAYKRHEAPVGRGMLCLGPARQEHLAAPCLAVPGAPLVVDGCLVGVLSWGFGCGYHADLPLVYSDMRYYNRWIHHVSERLKRIDSSNYTTLFYATRSALLNEWLNETRVAKYYGVDKPDSELQPWAMDQHLSMIQGTVYDLRDYLYDGRHSTEKARMYEVIRAMMIKDEKFQNKTETNFDPEEVVSDPDSDYDDYEAMTTTYKEEEFFDDSRSTESTSAETLSL